MFMPLLFCFFFSFLVPTLCWAQSTPPGTQPHIVVIIADDLGYNGLGYSNPNLGLESPTIDKLAMEGVRFKRHYAHMSCSPSRTSFQTGRLPVHVNTKNYHLPNPSGGIPRNMTTIAQVLQDVGYATHFVGKWDCGLATPFHMPVRRGYNTSLHYWSHANDYWKYTVPLGCPAPVVDLWENERPIPHVYDEEYEEFIFSKRMSRIFRHHDPTTPLFLVYASHVAHVPMQVPPGYINKYDGDATETPTPLPVPQSGTNTTKKKKTTPSPNPAKKKKATKKALRRKGRLQAQAQAQVTSAPVPTGWNSPAMRHDVPLYEAQLALLDNNVNDIVLALKRKRMWENTLILFTSDNGGIENNGKLLGRKNLPTEGGIRVAAFASGGLIPKRVRGTQTDQLMHIADWYGTFAKLAGADPTDYKAAAAGLPPVESVDLWPLISGANLTSPRTEIAISDTVFIQEDYKIATHKGTDYPCTNGCLFNVETDPGETTNLRPRYPDLFHQLVKRLQQLAKTFWENSDDGTNFNPSLNALQNQCLVSQLLYDGGMGPFQDLDEHFITAVQNPDRTQ